MQCGCPRILPAASTSLAPPVVAAHQQPICHNTTAGSSSLEPQLQHQQPAASGSSGYEAALPSSTTASSIERRQLGRTDLQVPIICFGTMLFGESQDYPTACQLLDACMAAGVDFFDSAEMYPVPQRADTQGLSEQYLGRWMQERNNRHKAIVASKVAGPSAQMTWIRGGPTALDAANITAALDDSLRRLQTDYIDLYQLHWPDRYVPMFGDLDYDPSYAYQATTPLEEQLEALRRAVEAGKVLHVGLSNETPWGLMKALAAADKPGDVRLPRVASIQNAYSLTCRTFDAGLAEVCHLEGVSLLAYSPLAMGLLTGKYLAADGGPAEARLNKYKGRYAEAESRYGPRPTVVNSVAAYAALAQQHGLSPIAMALRFVLRHPLVASAVVGASTLAQLQELIAAAAEGPLQDEQLLAAIDDIHERYPNPTP